MGALNFAAQSGIMEADAAPNGGLRNKDVVLHLKSVQTQNVNVQAVGGAAGATVATWTTIAIANSTNPFSGTLVAQIVQGAPATATIQLRIKGFDQFHESVVEITPVVTLDNVTNNFVYLARTFSYITSVEFKSTVLNSASATISVGSRWDWTRTDDATNRHKAGRNLGIAIPSRLSRMPIGEGTATRQKPVSTHGRTPVIGYMGTDPIVRYVADHHRNPRKHAFTLVVFSGVPANGDTLTLDGKVYTWKTAITAADGDVLIGSTLECRTNLAAAIRRASGLAGVKYGANTVEHPTITTGIGLLSIFGTETLPVVSKFPGARYNAVAVASVAPVAMSTAFLESGVDDPLEVLCGTVYDITGSGSAGAMTTLRPDAYAIGWNAAGWSGSIEKLHLVRQSFAAQWAVTDEILMTLAIASEDRR